MSNSKNDSETNSKSSFNKSKSISSAMDDLEMGRPISKATSDLELEDSTSDLEKSTSTNDLDDKSSSNVDLEIVSEEESKSDKESNYDDLSSFLDEDDEDESKSKDLNEDALVESEDLESVHKLDDNYDVQDNSEKDLVINDLNEDTDIFVSPSKITDKIDLDVIKKQEEPTIDFDEDVPLARPAKKSKDSTELFDSLSFKSISRPAKKSKDSKSKKFSKKFNFSIKNFKLFSGIELSTKSKIFAIVALLLGIVTIIYGILNFNNVSDRVIDHVLLGEAGSWSIFLIIIGLVIIIFDVFYISYSNKSVTKSNIKNSQIRNTFDVIDKIKSIDGEYYKEESDLDSLFDDILFDKESPNINLKNSDFKEDEIYVDQSVKDLDGIDSIESFEKTTDLDSENVSDSYDVDSLNDENSIFDKGTEDLSDLGADDLNVVYESEDLSDLGADDFSDIEGENLKSDKESNYDDLSSFLEEDEEDKVETSNKSEFKKTVDIDSLINDSKSKSIQDEDLAAKKARIIEGTNFDNSLRKSKK